MSLGDSLYSEGRIGFLRQSAHLGFAEIIQGGLKNPGSYSSP